MTLSEWRVSFPEFSGVEDALIQNKLDQAAHEVDSWLFGRFFDTAHGYLAAHYLTQSPYGQNARMIPSSQGSADNSSTYWKEYERLRAAATVGFRVC